MSDERGTKIIHRRTPESAAMLAKVKRAMAITAASAISRSYLFRPTRAVFGQFSLIWRTLISFHNRQKESGQAGAEREVERNDASKKGHRRRRIGAMSD